MCVGVHECGCPWPEVGGHERPVGCWLLSSSERAQSAFKYEPPLQHLHVKFASSLHLRFLSHILTKLSFMPDSLNGLFYIFLQFIFIL